MAQVYAIVHDGTNCLVFKKKEHGYFFDGKAVVPTVLNGAGAYCFPGGKKKGGSNETNAIREFLEETGMNLSDFASTKQELARVGYIGVFFNVGGKLTDIKNACQINLDKANAVAKHLKDNDITSGVVIGDTGSIVDNELSKKLKTMSFNDAITDGETFIEGDDNTGWFYDLVKNCP